MAFRLSTPSTNNSSKQRKSRYTQGGVVDVYPNRLGWWEARTIPRAIDDITVIIQPEEDMRPHRVAYRMYRNDKLAWLVLQYNRIVDLTEEFRAGQKIIIPSERRVHTDLLNRSNSGNTIRAV
jgi:hypothetical protein